MRPGSIGRPSNIPEPSASVLNEALRLIAGLGGGDKDTKKMLQEMRDVQVTNQKVAEEVKAYINEATKRDADLRMREDAVIKREAEVEALTIKQNNDAVRLQQQVQRENERLSDEANAQKMKYSEQMSELREFESSLTKKSDSLSKMESDVNARMIALENRELDYSRKKTIIDNIAKNIQLELRDL